MLERQRDRLDQKIAKLIEADDERRNRRDLLASGPGVGQTTANQLILEPPKVGRLNRQRLAVLVGVAPVNRDSGLLRGRRASWGGRATVRRALYMAAFATTTWNPVIKAYAARLRAASKASKVTMVACMRKLLTILNVLVPENLPWRDADLATSILDL